MRLSIFTAIQAELVEKGGIHMKKRLLMLTGVLTFGAVAALARAELEATVPCGDTQGVIGAPTGSEEGQVWQVRGGVTSMTLYENRLKNLGINLTDMRETGNGEVLLENPVYFGITSSSNLTFKVKNHTFSDWVNGTIYHRGGFTLDDGRNKHIVRNFSISYSNPGLPEHSLLFVPGGGRMGLAAESLEGPIIFDTSDAMIIFNPYTHRLLIAYVHMWISRELAMAMQRPELEGELLGVATIDAEIVKISGGWGGGPPRGRIDGGGHDLMLHSLDGIISLGREGAFPNGLNGLSMRTTICNVGNTDVPWFRPMDERHPVIAMNLYRLSDDRFEQVGASWLKHGFFSTNQDSCGTCDNPGTGQLLGPNCSDTYGSGNNGDRFWLGPRKELNPFTGRWTCRGSFFAGFEDDCVRRSGGAGWDNTQHRVEVTDADLSVSGATFVYEAFYFHQNEINIYDNLGWRPCTASWSGSRWQFATTDALTNGPAILNWGDMQETATPQTDGDAILAVKVTDIGGGMYHYEYTLYNMNMDRQLRQFSVPVEDGVTIQNIGFHDIDQDSGNDWTSDYSNGRISWFTDTFTQNPDANSLKYASIFNFRFDADRAPATTGAALGQFKPGGTDTLTAGTMAPAADTLILPDDVVVSFGEILSGSVGNLYFSDDSYVEAKELPSISALSPTIEFEVTATSPTQNPSAISVTVEGSTTGIPVVQKVLALNYLIGIWELVDERPASSSDNKITINLTGNLSRFIQPVTGRMSIKVGYHDLLVLFPAWTSSLDIAIWNVTP